MLNFHGIEISVIVFVAAKINTRVKLSQLIYKFCKQSFFFSTYIGVYLFIHERRQKNFQGELTEKRSKNSKKKTEK